MNEAENNQQPQVRRGDNEQVRAELLRLPRVTLTNPRQLRWVNEARERHNAMEAEYAFTTITELAQMPLMFDPAIDLTVKCLLLMVLYVKTAKPKDRTVSFFNKNGRGTGTATFDRIVVCVDLNAPEGENVVGLLLGGGQNVNFYLRYLDERDTGIFGR